MRALLPCKKALPSGSPDTVNTAVALQLSSKTSASVVVVVVAGFFFFFFFVVVAAAAVPRLLLLFFFAGIGAARWVLLTRDPTAPPAITFGDVRLSALPRAKRAVTIVATSRTLEVVRGAIERQLGVSALQESQKYVLHTKGWMEGVSFLDATIAKQIAALLVRRRLDQRTSHLGSACRASAMVAER
ncbi:hypothetical protein EDB85DRAFT_1565693 [Lactarius pseudohatsudake]|nr:hypothetical protein EDB85DRAFT_1565693 [Lactarius pseudohatsudake]